METQRLTTWIIRTSTGHEATFLARTRDEAFRRAQRKWGDGPPLEVVSRAKLGMRGNDYYNGEAEGL